MTTDAYDDRNLLLWNFSKWEFIFPYLCAQFTYFFSSEQNPVAKENPADGLTKNEL